MTEYPSLNRTALVVRPLKPYWDWANNIKDGIPSGMKNYTPTEMDTTVYLIPDLDPSLVQAHVEAIFAEIFEDELNAWWTKEEDWPKERTYEIFKKWFEVSIAPLIYDTDDGEIIKE